MLTLVASAYDTTVKFCASSTQYAPEILTQVAKNAAKVAIPTILLLAATNMPGAEAGPLAYASCMAGCAAMPPLCAAGGWAACLPLLAMPTP